MIGDLPYRFAMRPLGDDGGGGYLVEFPDLPGRMADGETIDEAITNARDAMACWLQAMRDAEPAHAQTQPRRGGVASAATVRLTPEEALDQADYEARRIFRKWKERGMV